LTPNESSSGVRRYSWSRTALELLGLHQVLDLLDHLLRADQVRQFGDDDALAARGDVLDPRRRAGAEAAAPGGVGVADAVQANDLAAGRQVGTGDVAHQVVERRVRVGQQVPGGADDLDEVVRRHVRRHPDGDPAGAVDQQVREGGRQHLRLGQLVVVVGDEVDRVLVEARGHQQCRGVEPCFCVVVDEAAGEEGMVIRRDANGVDGFRRTFLDLGDRHVAVARVHDRGRCRADLGILESVEDQGALVDPPFAAVDVVVLEPRPSRAAFRPHPGHRVVSDVGRDIAAQAVRRRRKIPQQAEELRLLGGDETDVVGECLDVVTSGNDQTVLAPSRVIRPLRMHSELKEQLLEFERQGLAECRVLNGYTIIGTDSDAAVALEGRHEEGALDAGPATPDHLWHVLVGGPLSHQVGQRTGDEGAHVLDVELVDLSSGTPGPTRVHVSAAADQFVVRPEDVVEEHLVGVVESGSVMRSPAFTDPSSRQQTESPFLGCGQCCHHRVPCQADHITGPQLIQAAPGELWHILPGDQTEDRMVAGSP
jgi:hypothetical protein